MSRLTRNSRYVSVLKLLFPAYFTAPWRWNLMFWPQNSIRKCIVKFKKSTREFFTKFVASSKSLHEILHLSPFSMAYSVSQKNPPRGLVAILPKRLGIFQLNFTCLLRIPTYARLRIFIRLSATLTKLCYIKCDHPVQIKSRAQNIHHRPKCTQAFSDIFPKQLGILVQILHAY